MHKPYYNHDDIWQAKKKGGVCHWGPETSKHYENAVTLIRMFAPQGGDLLDAGCGAGAFGALLAEMDASFRYTGVDVSHTAVMLGRDQFSGLSLEIGDLAEQTLPLHWEGAFDFVTVIQTLDYLTEAYHRRQFLENLHLALKGPGKRILLATQCGPLRPGVKNSKPPRLFVDPYRIVDELAKAGFEKILLFQLFQPNDSSHIPVVYLIAEA